MAIVRVARSRCRDRERERGNWETFEGTIEPSFAAVQLHYFGRIVPQFHRAVFSRQWRGLDRLKTTRVFRVRLENREQDELLKISARRDNCECHRGFFFLSSSSSWLPHRRSSNSSRVSRGNLVLFITSTRKLSRGTPHIAGLVDNTMDTPQWQWQWQTELWWTRIVKDDRKESVDFRYSWSGLQQEEPWRRF